MQRFHRRGVLGGVTNPIVTLAPQDDPPAALDALYRRHWVGLVRLAVLVVDDRQSAEDVVQEVFTELYRKCQPGRIRVHSAPAVSRRGLGFDDSAAG